MNLISPAIGSTVWVKSSYSGAEHSECVEAAFVTYSIALRDSKRPMGETVSFGDVAWRVFIEGLRNAQP
ncbi:DUF397 domain-containing protein [Streptomyces sp. NPDC001549]|uniref:DUF397 domain-containing protein n=1 Tax=Streptomyces sp. NPDC001549 TaxID=3364586 RepID=UPI0036755D28